MIFFLLASQLWAADVPDGAWNGKPWDRRILLAGVKKENPDALAEWAYCARRGLLQFSYNEELIYQRAKQAADGGSLVGKRLEAKCQMIGCGVKEDEKAAMEKLRRLAELGVPDAWVDLGIKEAQIGPKGYAKAEELYKKALDGGSIRAIGSMSRLTLKQDYPKLNLREGYRLRAKSFLLSKDVFDASDVLYLRSTKGVRGYEDLFTPTILAQAREVLNEGLILNHPSAMYRLSWEEYKKPNGDKHLAVMLQIRAANLGNTDAMKTLTNWIGKGVKVKYGGSYQVLINSSGATMSKTAKYAYDAGIRSNQVVHTYARQLARGGKKGHPMAAKLLKGLIAKGLCDAHDELGLMLVGSHIEHGAPKAEADRGFANLIYHSNHSSNATYFIMWLQSYNKKASCYDLVRATASGRYYLDKFKAKNNQIVINDATKRLKQAEQFNDEDKAEYQRLLDTGYPASEIYRREAFELLRKSGDLPADARFAE